MTHPVTSEHAVPRNPENANSFNKTSLGRFGLFALVAGTFVACGGGPDNPLDPNDDGSLVTSSVAASGTGGSGSTPASTGADGHTGGTSDHGCNPGDDGQGGDDVDPHPGPDTLWPAKGLKITRITLNQGVRHLLMDADGEADNDTPVIAGRPGIVRVFYTQFAKHNANEVLARLTIGETVIDKTVVHGESSTDDDLQSTINFDLPGELIGMKMSYKVELLHPATGEWGVDVDGSTFPLEAQQSVAIRSTGDGLKIVLVPVSYGAEKRLPDLSPAQIELHREAIMDIYPVQDVELTVRPEVLQWDKTITADGGGWAQLLTAVADLRTTDHAANDTYYYGVFSPAASFGSFCSSGCVAGLGFVSPEFNSWSRAAIGLGFAGEKLAGVFAHELGHNHGRKHSPCGGPKSPDPTYPHPDGIIGDWGFDISDGTLHAPDLSRDFMSYCDPAWVSSFTYNALFERARLLNGVLPAVETFAQPRQYDRVILGTKGQMEWASETMLDAPPQGEIRDVDVTSDAGTRQETATFVPFDHIDGGVLFVPRPIRSNNSTRARSLSFEQAGQIRRLTR